MEVNPNDNQIHLSLELVNFLVKYKVATLDDLHDVVLELLTNDEINKLERDNHITINYDLVRDEIPMDEWNNRLKHKPNNND